MSLWSDITRTISGLPAFGKRITGGGAYLSDEDYKRACKRIMMLPIPDRDPATGEPMPEWHAAPSSVDAGWNDWRTSLDARSAKIEAT